MITFYFQLLIPLALMFVGMPRREKFWLRLSVSLALTLLCSCAYYTTDILFFANEFWKYLVYYLIGYLFGFLVAWFCFDIPLINTVFFTVEAYIVQNFSHHVFIFIIRLLDVPVGADYDTPWRLVLLGIVYAIVYTVFFLLVWKLKLREDISVPKLSLAVEFIFFIVMVGFGVYVRHVRTELFAERTVAIGYEVYSIVLALLMLSMLLGLFNIGKLRDSNEELEMRIDHEGKYYEIARTNADEIGQMCHNLKHQIAALRNMDNITEKEEIISEMEKSVSVYGSIAKTGNSALDSILTEKGIYCYSNGIVLSVIADGSLLNGVKFNDIYTLFGNAIDNAIESVMKTDRKDQRIIGLKICKRGGMAYIHLENWFDADLKYVDGLPITTKRERGHGFGVRSIKYIVEKYGGNLNVGTNDQIFFLDILLPIKET